MIHVQWLDLQSLMSLRFQTLNFCTFNLNKSAENVYLYTKGMYPAAEKLKFANQRQENTIRNWIQPESSNSLEDNLERLKLFSYANENSVLKL
jgi:hypothetical protein